MNFGELAMAISCEESCYFAFSNQMVLILSSMLGSFYVFDLEEEGLPPLLYLLMKDPQRIGESIPGSQSTYHPRDDFRAHTNLRGRM